MSYILDALKRVERERYLARVPTLATVHASKPDRRRRVWPWVVVGALLANAAVLIVLFRFPQPGVTSRAKESSPRSAASPPPVVQAPAESKSPAGGPAEERATARSAVAAVAPGPTDQKSPSGDSSGTRTGGVGSRDQPVSTEGSAVPATPPLSRTAGPPETSATGKSSMKLEVVVYSENPLERAVYINGRRYVEGQSVDGRLVVEKIVRDGVVLRGGGQRFLLRM